MTVYRCIIVISNTIITVTLTPLTNRLRIVEEFHSTRRTVDGVASRAYTTVTRSEIASRACVVMLVVYASGVEIGITTEAVDIKGVNGVKEVAHSCIACRSGGGWTLDPTSVLIYITTRSGEDQTRAVLDSTVILGATALEQEDTTKARESHRTPLGLHADNWYPFALGL